MTRTENERLAVVESDVRHLTMRHEEFRAESRAKHEEFRGEVRGEFREVRNDVASLNDKIDRIENILTKAQGGWLAVVGGWRALIVVGSLVSGFAVLVNFVWGWVAPFASSLPR